MLLIISAVRYNWTNGAQTPGFPENNSSNKLAFQHKLLYLFLSFISTGLENLAENEAFFFSHGDAPSVKLKAGSSGSNINVFLIRGRGSSRALNMRLRLVSSQEKLLPPLVSTRNRTQHSQLIESVPRTHVLQVRLQHNVFTNAFPGDELS